MDISSADLGLLRALDVLLAERNVTRAAARLGLSQPALSAQLARLRDLFDDRLLVQAGRHMVPTPRAVAVAGRLRTLLTELDDLVRDRPVFDAATARRDLRIAASDFLHHTISLRLASQLRHEAPGVRLALLSLSATDPWGQLEAEAADLLLSASRSAPLQAISRTLFHESFVMAQRRDHPRGAGPIDLETFCALDHLLVSTSGGGFAGATDAALKRIGRSRLVALSVPSFLLAPPMLAASDLVAVVPRRLAAAFSATLDMVEAPLTITGFSVAAVWHPRRHDDPALIWLRNRLAALT